MNQEKIAVNGLIAGAGVTLGAGLMYLLDPATGRRRRARIRDKAIRLSHTVEDATETIGRDLVNRSRGIAATIKKPLHNGPVDDQVLAPRVRSEMGRCVSHPHAISVEAQDGRIILSGFVLKSEEQDVINCARQVPGVKEVESRLQGRTSPKDIPPLQGGAHRERRFEFLQKNWAPAPRMIAGAGGAAMIAYGILNRQLPGLGIALAGGLLLTRAVTNIELKRLIA